MSRVDGGFVELDMRILLVCRDVALTRTQIGRRLGIASTGKLFRGLSGRVDVLVKRGLLVAALFANRRLNGKFKGETRFVFACSDDGAQALFYYTLFREFYDGSGVEGNGVGVVESRKVITDHSRGRGCVKRVEVLV